MCDIAYVSRMVTSHASALPLDHGISVAPSGLMQFLRTRPVAVLENKTGWLFVSNYYYYYYYYYYHYYYYCSYNFFSIINIIIIVIIIIIIIL